MNKEEALNPYHHSQLLMNLKNSQKIQKINKNQKIKTGVLRKKEKKHTPIKKITEKIKHAKTKQKLRKKREDLVVVCLQRREKVEGKPKS